MKKKLLIILPYVPYPPKSGGQIAVFEMINHLREKFDITIVIPFYRVYSESIEELKMIWTDVKIICMNKTLKNRIKRKLSFYLFGYFLKNYTAFFNILESNAFNINSFFFDLNIDLIRLVNNLIKEVQFDFVQIEFYEYLPLITFLPDNIKSIFVHHELRFIRDERSLQLFKDEDYALAKYFLAMTKGQEIELLKKYDKVVTVSDVDKTILCEYLDMVKILSSPLTIKSKHVLKDEYVFENRLFFLGGSEHSANVNALDWFLENCWAGIADERPDLKIVVIGSWDEKLKNQFSKKTNRIVFPGFVKDLGSVLKNGILIIPILVGSGMRMKIIDSVNYGIPFITTSVGVEGLNFVDSESCFIADSPIDFVNKLKILIDSRDIQKLFIKNSQLLLREKYSFERLMNIRESIYN